jgi:hypothetical protein
MVGFRSEFDGVSLKWYVCPTLIRIEIILIHNAFEVYYHKDNMGCGQDLSTPNLKDVNPRHFAD